MTDFTQMFRWNAGFVRGLAQSVLARAKVIRSSLTPYAPEASAAAPTGKKVAKKKKSSPKASLKREVKAKKARAGVKKAGRAVSRSAK